MIGILLLNLNHNIVLEVRHQICTDALVLESHRIIYKIILNYSSQHSKLNLAELAYYLSKYQLLYKVGGFSKLLQLMNQVLVFQKISGQTLLIENYIKIIQDKHIRRLIIQWATYIVKLGLSQSIELSSLFQQASKHLEKIFTLFQHRNSFSLSVTLQDLIDNFYLEYKKSNIITGLQSGFENLDELTQGFQPSDLVILAGRPGMGKTSVVLNMANYILQSAKHGVILFSFEMTKKQILYRLLSIQNTITIRRLQQGAINKNELDSIKHNCQALTQSFFYINDNPNTTILQLYLKTKRMVQQYVVGLIAIDYLQLIQNSNFHFKNRVQELSSMTRILKILARETSIALIVLSQLNRNVENRPDKKPLLSDLRESGCFQGEMKLEYQDQPLKANQTTNFFTNFVISLKNLLDTSKPCKAKEFFRNLQYTYLVHPISYVPMNFGTTDNHKILVFCGWKQENHLFPFDTLTIIDKFYWHCSLFTIQWSKYEPVYDIKVNQLLNLQISHAILHNSIEQDADLVLLLYRSNYYASQKTTDHGAEIIVAKHRNGPTGSFELHFNASCTVFTNS